MVPQPFPADLKTLPDDHPVLALLLADEVVLRRFNTQNDHEAELVLDWPGEYTYQVLSEAFIGFSQDGCSVFRLAVLEAAGLPAASVVEGELKYRSVCAATVGAITDLEIVSGHGPVRPFTVAIDAYPDEEYPIKAHVAHALIRLDGHGLSKAQVKAARSQLAQTRFRYYASYPAVA